MKKTIRLTESDLIKIVQRVIKEQETDESTFTFGDKVRNKLGKLVGLPERTDDEERLADDILNKVESGDYNMLDDTFEGSSTGWFKFKVSLEDGNFNVRVSKLRSLEGANRIETIVKTPDGKTVYLPKGFTKKLIDLIKKDDKGERFRYPKNK
jgi:hypothetical protein